MTVKKDELRSGGNGEEEKSLLPRITMMLMP